MTMSEGATPAATVVIPSFRGGALLREAIASVQAQTLSDWELVVVLDGSEDDLSDIEGSDERVRVVRQRNRGESIARNVGIRWARSALVAFLDDDDRMLPDRLRAQVAAMSDEGVGLCHTQIQVIDENGAVIGKGGSKECQYRDFLRGDGAILIGSSMVRKALIQDVGAFNPLFPLGADIDLAYRMARESRLHFLPDVLTEYRRHSSNTWSTTWPGVVERTLTLQQHLFVAQIRGEADNVQSIRRGLSLISSHRASGAILRAEEARTRGNRLGMLAPLGLAFLLSPVFTTRMVLRKLRKLQRESHDIS